MIWLKFSDVFLDNCFRFSLVFLNFIVVEVIVRVSGWNEWFFVSLGSLYLINFNSFEFF